MYALRAACSLRGRPRSPLRAYVADIVFLLEIGGVVYHLSKLAKNTQFER